MKQKKLTINRKYNQVCRECLGEGVVTIPGYDHGHGRTEEPKTDVCSVCQGACMVTVEKEINITITPKFKNK